MYFAVTLVAFSVYEGGFAVTFRSVSTSKMMLMCISGGLEGLKTESVEKLLVLNHFWRSDPDWGAV